ncbi:MAG: putative nucleotidyltransferase substrate binding domain-containing protein, partial [Kiloniellales bacterium]
FNRLLTEKHDPAHKGKVDLKYAGTLPLAEAVRLLALRAGIRDTGTLARIEALGAINGLGADEQDRLRAAFDHVTGLQLRQQIADYQAGQPVSNFVDPASLTAREIDLLKDAFRAINDFRVRVRADLTGELL